MGHMLVICNTIIYIFSLGLKPLRDLWPHLNYAMVSFFIAEILTQMLWHFGVPNLIFSEVILVFKSKHITISVLFLLVHPECHWCLLRISSMCALFTPLNWFLSTYSNELSHKKKFICTKFNFTIDCPILKFTPKHVSIGELVSRKRVWLAGSNVG